MTDERAKSGRWRRWLIGDFTWKRLIRSVVLSYLVLVVIGLFFSEWLIFPYRGSSYDESLAGLEIIEGGDGQRLATRYWERAGAERLILLFHGNAEDLGHLDWIASEMQGAGFSVLAMDYRGYGLSEGAPTEEGCYTDAERLYDTALAKGFSAEEILLWGRSVGGGTAVELAVRRPVGGIVLESAFVTAFRAATRVPIVPFDRFDNLSKLGELEMPLFVTHGTEDEIVGYWHGERLYAAYGGRKRFFAMDGAGHNDLWAFDVVGMLREVRAFFVPAGGQVE